MKRYGDLLRKRREDLNYGLREFADLVGVKPSNLSDIENNKKAPYFSPALHEEILQFLQIPPHSDIWYQFFDAAQREETFPKDVELAAQGKEEAVTSLLRTVGRKQLTEDQIRQTEEWINKQWSASSHDV